MFGVVAVLAYDFADIDIVLGRSRGDHPDVPDRSLSALGDCEGFAQHLVVC